MRLFVEFLFYNYYNFNFSTFESKIILPSINNFLINIELILTVVAFFFFPLENINNHEFFKEKTFFPSNRNFNLLIV